MPLARLECPKSRGSQAAHTAVSQQGRLTDSCDVRDAKVRGIAHETARNKPGNLVIKLTVSNRIEVGTLNK